MNRRNEAAYSIIEVSIGIFIVGIGTLIASSLFSNANKSSAYATFNGIKTTTVLQVNQLMAQATESASVYQFDPAHTMVETPSGWIRANEWELGPAPGTIPPIEVTIRTNDVIPFNLGSQTYKQDSHFLHVFKVDTDPTTRAITKRTVHALASRCIDSEKASYPLATAEILALPKPVFKDKRVYCCADPAACPSGTSNRKTLWPAIFVIRGDGQNKIVPVDSERKVVLGAGFMVLFNRKRKPDTATFTTFIVENRCMLTPIGFQSGRFPVGCTQGDKLPVPYRASFETDLFYILLNQTSRPLASDFSGSGFMKL
jgi:type II secretory pathway pseudopilin PulG